MPTFGRPRMATAISSVPSSTGRPPPSTASSRSTSRVEQLAGAAAVQRRDRDRLAQPEPVQVERRRLVGGVVDLVRDHDHRPVRAAQDLGDLLVARREAGAGVDHDRDHVGLLDGPPRLGRDLRLHGRVVADVDAAGVDQDERAPAPVAGHLVAVARHARALVDDRVPRRREPVHERRLARVREARRRRRRRRAPRRRSSDCSYMRADLGHELVGRLAVGLCRAPLAALVPPRRAEADVHRAAPGRQSRVPRIATGTTGTSSTTAQRPAPAFAPSSSAWRWPWMKMPTTPPAASVSWTVRSASRSASPRRTGKAPPQAMMRPEDRDAEELGLGHVADRARLHLADGRDVPPRPVVGDDQHRSGRRDVLDAVHARAQHDAARACPARGAAPATSGRSGRARPRSRRRLDERGARARPPRPPSARTCRSTWASGAGASCSASPRSRAAIVSPDLRRAPAPGRPRAGRRAPRATPSGTP